MATRYKVTKEQVEKLVENFVMESSSEAKKHIQGSVQSEKVGHSLKTNDGRGGKKQAPEAKKHIKGSTEGPEHDSVSEVDPGTKEDEQSHAPEAKKHIKGKVSENSRKRVVLTEGVIDDIKNYFKTKFMDLVDTNPEVAAAYEKVQDEASRLNSSEKQTFTTMDPEEASEELNLGENFVIKNNKILVEAKFWDKVQTYLGLGVSGTAFISAVAALVKAAIGAGMFTFGLPVGVIVAIAMGVFAVSGFVGHSGYNKLKDSEQSNEKPPIRRMPNRPRYDSSGRRR